MHHVTPLSKGGELMDKNNVEMLCEPCHIAHHREENSYRKTYVTPDGEIVYAKGKDPFRRR